MRRPAAAATVVAALTHGAYRPFVFEPDLPVAKWDETVLAVRAALDEQTFSEATAVGSRMSIEELIAFSTTALERARAQAAR